MSVTYRQSAGTRAGGAGTRNISSITASGVVATTLDIGGTFAVGDILEIISTTSPANNGFYTLVAHAGTPAVPVSPYTLRPAPAPQGTVGQIGRCPNLTTYPIPGNRALTTVSLSPFDPNIAFIQVSRAKFISNGVLRNDRVAISGSTGGQTANNGAWIIDNVMSEEVVSVRTPDGGVGMIAAASGTATGAVQVRQGRVVMSITNENPVLATKTGTPTFTIDGTLQTITRSTGSWIAEGFAAGQRVTVGGTTFNNGITSQLTSLSATVLTFANESFVDESVAASGSFRAHAITWETLAASGVPLPSVSGGLYFGSGKMRDYIRISGIASSNETRKFIELTGVSSINFDQSGLGAESTFLSLDEILVSNTSGTNPSLDGLNTGSWAGNLVFFIGLQPGDRYSISRGSGWVGLGTSGDTTMPFNIFGSYLDCTGSFEVNLMNGGNSTGSLIRPRLNTFDGVVESVICYGDVGGGGGGLAGNAAGDQNNVLLGNQSGGSAVAVAATFGGLLLSSTVASPTFNNNATPGLLTIQDPRTDFDLVGVVSNSFTGTANKTYLFSPRFVSRDSAGSTPTTISGLGVQVYEINESDLSESLVIDTTTSGNGTIIGSYLQRQFLSTTEVPTYFSHRVILQGGGFRRGNEVIQMTSPRTEDWAVDRISPDYEGEYDE